MNLYRVLAAVTASAIAAVLLATPANADSGTSPVTLTIISGTLSISMPGSTLTLTATSNASSTNTATTSLGLVTVTDSRSASPAIWATTVSSTDFVAPTPVSGPTPPSIPVGNISYTVYGSNSSNAGALSLAQGNAGSVITGNTAARATYTAPLTSAGQAFVSTSTGVGDAVVTWNPLITITIPSTAVAGVAYAATITQSVL